jgi:hypothetical protein
VIAGGASGIGAAMMTRFTSQASVETVATFTSGLDRSDVTTVANRTKVIDGRQLPRLLRVARVGRTDSCQ